MVLLAKHGMPCEATAPTYLHTVRLADGVALLGATLIRRVLAQLAMLS